MRIKYAIAAAALLVTACGVSESKFASKAGDLTCERLAECSDLVDEAECKKLVEDAEASESEYTCDYDGKAAKKCLKEIKDAECPSDGIFVTPSICSDVSTNCTPS